MLTGRFGCCPTSTSLTRRWDWCSGNTAAGVLPIVGVSDSGPELRTLRPANTRNRVRHFRVRPSSPCSRAGTEIFDALRRLLQPWRDGRRASKNASPRGSTGTSASGGGVRPLQVAPSRTRSRHGTGPLWPGRPSPLPSPRGRPGPCGPAPPPARTPCHSQPCAPGPPVPSYRRRLRSTCSSAPPRGAGGDHNSSTERQDDTPDGRRGDSPQGGRRGE